MDPLKPGDPSSIAGYRLLGRLGAGGMGVVYLARSDRGALAAVKVIRAEYAADPGFRARFRRETEIAQRITGRWVVRMVGADPLAREPWLATEFVPGPSLVEAVALHGPLPPHTVRALGVRLAEALAGAHRAGLVHRDVKPGNVLLALDGPRLIDFGIARSVGATSLTTTDVMIGSPGYLAPEQARAAGSGEIGPASDIFSLGCVLAYAATGRRPFGTGTVAAIVFRTVHEEPDLDGIPPSLVALVRGCLSKEPAERPTAMEVRAALQDRGVEEIAEPRDAAAGGDEVTCGEVVAAEPRDALPGGGAAVDPRAAFLVVPGEGGGTDPHSPDTGPLGRSTRDSPPADEPHPPGPEPWMGGEGSTGKPRPLRADDGVAPGATAATDTDDESGAAAGDWLPDGLPALIAQRSSHILDLPVPEPTVVVKPTTRPPASRRRFLVLGSAAAVATVGGAAAWLANRPSDEGEDRGVDGSEGAGGPARHVIGVQTDLSGPHQAAGRAQERGARLAVEMFNARRDRPFDLALRVLDDGGDPGRARAAAGKFGADASLVAVLGLTSTAVAKAVVPRYGEYGLPVLTVSLSSGPFALAGAKGYFELRPIDNMLIHPVDRYFALKGTERVALIHDLAGGQVSWSIVKSFRETPAAMGEIAIHTIDAASADFPTVVRAALATTPDGVIYLGNSPSRAALAARALYDQGFSGLRGAIEPVLEPEFIAEAGEAAEGWVFGTSYADPAGLPAARQFNAAYRRRWKATASERYAAEAYDAVFFLAQGMRELGAERVQRRALVTRLRQLRYEGITKPIAFRAATQNFDETRQLVGLFLYRVEDGSARFLGPYATLTAKT